MSNVAVPLSIKVTESDDASILYGILKCMFGFTQSFFIELHTSIMDWDVRRFISTDGATERELRIAATAAPKMWCEREFSK